MNQPLVTVDAYFQILAGASITLAALSGIFNIFRKTRKIDIIRIQIISLAGLGLTSNVLFHYMVVFMFADFPLVSAIQWNLNSMYILLILVPTVYHYGRRIDVFFDNLPAFVTEGIEQPYKSGSTRITKIIFFLCSFTILAQVVNLYVAWLGIVILGQYLIFLAGAIQFWLLITDDSERDILIQQTT
ncbi:MAG: hypothetical protein AAFQ52_04230 [Chloroflexota bacterium]